MRRSGDAPLEGVGSVEVTDCKLKGADVAYRVYQARKGAILYSAEGFAGYDSALRLGLRSVVADKALPGELSIATTGVGDAAALARVQAGAIDASRALAEAYRRNNTGSYAESAEFFSSVSQGGDSQSAKAEGLSNEALQKSNLGRYDEADALFGRAAQLVGANPIVARQYPQLPRNAPAEPRRSQGRDGRARQAGADRPDGFGRQRQGAGDRRCGRRAPQRRIAGVAPARNVERRAPAGGEDRRSSTARRFSCAEPRCGCRAISPAQARPWLRPMPSSPAFAADG